VNWYSLATYELAGQQHPGLVVNNTLYALAEAAQACGIEASRLPQDLTAAIADWSRHAPMLADVASRIPPLHAAGRLAAVDGAATYAAPYQPRRIFGTASNFYEHADEMGTKLAARSESQPYIFMKAETSVVATGATVLMPPETHKLDWEVELGVVIGKTCRHVPAEDALSVIAGYTVFNDISARDLNRRTDYPFSHDWFRGKSFDTFGPMGPWLVPADCIPDPQNLRMTLLVNGETMQNGKTRRTCA
jgi:2-keto-4-pentenoate hydratase/2-oxohepta-3-ene-1,7-dioic acid hydratase in catechol pathway